jgi:GNAT superfamily N-acetyltransferase
MDVVVRPAGVDDAPAISALYVEIADEVVERESRVRHVPDQEGVRARYEARVQEPDRAVFVAVVDGSVVGFADVALIRTVDEATYHTPGIDVYVEELIVTASTRRVGIGRSLMGFVEAWAKQAGARMATLDTHVSNGGARDFYAAIGYRDIGVILAKNL